jgi:hypothetical protein
MGFELPFDTKRLEQLLFPSNPEQSVLMLVSSSKKQVSTEELLHTRLRSLTSAKLLTVIQVCQMSFNVCVGVLKAARLFYQPSCDYLVNERLQLCLRFHRLSQLGSLELIQRNPKAQLVVIMPELPPNLLFHALLGQSTKLANLNLATLSTQAWKTSIPAWIDEVHHVLRLIGRHLQVPGGNVTLGNFGPLDAVLTEPDLVNDARPGTWSELGPQLCRHASFRSVLDALFVPRMLQGVLTILLTLQKLTAALRTKFPGHCPSGWSGDVQHSQFVVSGTMTHVWSLLFDAIHFLTFLVRCAILLSRHTDEQAHAYNYQATDQKRSVAVGSKDKFSGLLTAMAHVLPASPATSTSTTAETTVDLTSKRVHAFFEHQAQNCDNVSIALDYVDLCIVLTPLGGKNKHLGALCFSLLFHLYPYIHLPVDSTPGQGSVARQLSLQFLSVWVPDKRIVAVEHLSSRSGLVPSKLTGGMSVMLVKLRKQLWSLCARKPRLDFKYASSFQIQALFWNMLAYGEAKHWLKQFTALAQALRRFVVRVTKANDSTGFYDDTVKSMTTDSAPLYFELLFTGSLLAITQLRQRNGLKSICALMQLINTLLEGYIVTFQENGLPPYFRQASARKSMDLVRSTLHKCMNVMFPVFQFQLVRVITDFHSTNRGTADDNVLRKTMMTSYRTVELAKKIITLLQADRRRKQPGRSALPRNVARMEGFRSFLNEQVAIYEIDITSRPEDEEEKEEVQTAAVVTEVKHSNAPSTSTEAVRGKRRLTPVLEDSGVHAVAQTRVVKKRKTASRRVEPILEMSVDDSDDTDAEATDVDSEQEGMLDSLMSNTNMQFEDESDSGDDVDRFNAELL